MIKYIVIWSIPRAILSKEEIESRQIERTVNLTKPVFFWWSKWEYLHVIWLTQLVLCKQIKTLIWSTHSLGNLISLCNELFRGVLNFTLRSKSGEAWAPKWERSRVPGVMLSDAYGYRYIFPGMLVAMIPRPRMLVQTRQITNQIVKEFFDTWT